MAEEAARVADGGLGNASRSSASFRRDPTKDAAHDAPGGEECGSVPSRRDGRLVVLVPIGTPRYYAALPSKE